MAILSTVKKGYMTIKTASGYVKLLPRTLSTLVAMSDGTSVEDKITALNSKSTQNFTQTINGLSCKFYFTKIGNTVQCAIDAVGSLNSSNAGVNGVIPEAYRPIYVTRLVAKNISGSSEFGTTQYRIDKEGRVEIASGELRNAERYVTGCWLTN